ncbi:hypothetical protein B0H34DRAFT_793474 [Crassisporium funariophilum]|nr:hypothetical protein B0H34DRAFT_793474 [Crassisporium funariophilum]
MSDNSSVAYSAYKRPIYKSKQPTGDGNTTRPKTARENSDHLLSYYESSLANEGRSYARSTSPEKPAASTAHHHSRKISTTSTSSSDYSYDSETTDARDAGSEASNGATRRSGTPSKGGADRRRVAIVQLDEDKHQTYSDVGSTTSSIRSRRGHKSNLSGLALVAPPDAAPRTYTHLTPPSTAPITGDNMNHSSLTVQQDKGHHRSASELSTLKKVPSRDIAYQSAQTAKLNQNTIKDNNNPGAPRSRFTYASTTRSRSPSPTHSANSDRPEYARGLLSPPDSAYPSRSAIAMYSPMITPEIGESKEIHIPVVGPVVVSLDSRQARKAASTASRTESPVSHATASLVSTSSPYAPSAASTYLNYQPGVHSTAGPLPPPPRATFTIDSHTPPPPRPPRLHSPAPARTRRDLDAVKQALQLPPSVSAVLASKSPNVSERKPPHVHPEDTAETRDTNNLVSKVSAAKSNHRREGAFPSSTQDDSPLESGSIVSSPAPPTPTATKLLDDLIGESKDTVLDTNIIDSAETDIPSVTVVQPAASTDVHPAEVDHQKFSQWLQTNPDFSLPLEPKRGVSIDEHKRNLSPERAHSPLSENLTGTAPSPPPKSFRNSLTTNLKRFSSLPRTPSLSSRSDRRSSAGTRYSSRTPSPSLHPVSPPPIQKIRSSNPAALFCHEVHSQRTTSERCIIYASKINELYLYDCGLSEWVVSMKDRGPNTHAPRAPSSQAFTPQPRHTSRSSMISEATFPRRPDASTATDLSQGAYRDITPPGAPPPLPYPSLAINPPRTYPSRSSSSVGSGTPPSSIRSLAPSAPSLRTGGFFASLGRKASISTSRRDRPNPLASSPGPLSSGSGRLPPKNSPITLNISRPINITHPPSVPGGPRAPPSRAQRSQTFMSSVSPTSSDREDAMGRRPSLFNFSKDTVLDISAEPDFHQQVDKLHVLLPHADREVLAGYLRRAGQDMLAIGQYLEDERMGTIRQL